MELQLLLGQEVEAFRPNGLNALKGCLMGCEKVEDKVSLKVIETLTLMGYL